MTPSKQPSVAIVILNYNGMGKQYLERFLPSVYNTFYDNWALYVVDNASTDNSVEYLKQEGFQTEGTPIGNGNRFLIELDQNYGFAGGYNEGLKTVKADYYVLLNSDVEVAPNWVLPVVELMESDPQIAVCQPKIRMYDEKLLFEHAGAAGGWIDYLGYPFCRGRIFNVLEADKAQYNDTAEIFWATGAAMFIKASLYHQFEGFDASYFAHMEEIDLCWRLKRANYKVMCCPESVVWHVGGGTLPKSNPRKTFLNFRNSLTTLFKNEPGLRAYRLVFVRLLLDAPAALLFLLKGEFKNIGALIKAHWTFFGSFGKIRAKKVHYQKLVDQYAYQGKAQFNATGYYPKSIVLQHFIKAKQSFKQLFEK